MAADDARHDVAYWRNRAGRASRDAEYQRRRAQRLERENKALRDLSRKFIWYFWGEDWVCNTCEWVKECPNDPPCIAPRKMEEMARNLGFEVMTWDS